MNARDPAYIGDGVHVGHDGYQLWLWTERENGEHSIALEPAVFARLLDYEQGLRAKYASPLDEAAAHGPGPELE